MTDLYADASALAKLVIAERESLALLRWLGDDRRTPASSAIARVELARAVHVSNPAADEELRDLLGGLTLLPVDDGVLAEASRLATGRLRTLDAIHLASALTLGVAEMLVYDARLAEAAEAAGIDVVAPGR